MGSFKGRKISASESNRRKREFRELERKSTIGVIAAVAFILVVVTIVVYFGLNVHDH
jgi:hypothetical protein